MRRKDRIYLFYFLGLSALWFGGSFVLLWQARGEFRGIAPRAVTNIVQTALVSYASTNRVSAAVSASPADEPPRVPEPFLLGRGGGKKYYYFDYQFFDGTSRRYYLWRGGDETRRLRDLAERIERDHKLLVFGVYGYYGA